MVTALFSLDSRSAYVTKDMLEISVIKSLIHVGRIHVSIWDSAHLLMMGNFSVFPSLVPHLFSARTHVSVSLSGLVKTVNSQLASVVVILQMKLVLSATREVETHTQRMQSVPGQ